MNGETLLLRQVNPCWVQQGRITSQVFRPMPKDAGKLSAYDGDMITAENSWGHYTKTLTFQSVGVMAVSASECSHEELDVEPDPEPFVEHVLIDFSHHSLNQQEKKSKRLRSSADKRGWLYLATEGKSSD